MLLAKKEQMKVAILDILGSKQQRSVTIWFINPSFSWIVLHTIQKRVGVSVAIGFDKEAWTFENSIGNFDS